MNKYNCVGHVTVPFIRTLVKEYNCAGHVADPIRRIILNMESCVCQVCLLLFYILATAKVISGWRPTRGNFIALPHWDTRLSAP